MWVGAAIAVVAAGLFLVPSLGKKGRADMSADGVLGELDEDGEDGEGAEIAEGAEGEVADVAA
jgi:hypothetical protein